MRVEKYIKFKVGDSVKIVNADEVDTIEKVIISSNQYRGYSNWYILKNKRCQVKELDLIQTGELDARTTLP